MKKCPRCGFRSQKFYSYINHELSVYEWPYCRYCGLCSCGCHFIDDKNKVRKVVL